MTFRHTDIHAKTYSCGVFLTLRSLICMKTLRGQGCSLCQGEGYPALMFETVPRMDSVYTYPRPPELMDDMPSSRSQLRDIYSFSLYDYMLDTRLVTKYLRNTM